MRGFSFSTIETVATETMARLATSRRLTGLVDVDRTGSTVAWVVTLPCNIRWLVPDNPFFQFPAFIARLNQFNKQINNIKKHFEKVIIWMRDLHIYLSIM
jgi:ABC-type uncharacterized transport system fused permease/ATPase subunit